MTKIDEFESLFKSAAKPVFHPEPIRIERVAIVVDQPLDACTEYIERLEGFLRVLNSVDNTVEIKHVSGESFSSVHELMDLLHGCDSQLICTYRNLHGDVGNFPFSLGEYVDVLTQATPVPILLLPGPGETGEQGLRNTDRVMVMTDHLAGDSRLVTYGAIFTQDHGELILSHVEDRQTFERYMQAISKIPSIDTEVATEVISQQLLKEPKDYVRSCKDGLDQAGLPLTVKAVVTMGHHLNDYKQLVQDHEADLLVLNTKDDDQMAMHGLAYPVSVELRQIPLLLI